MSLLYQLQNDPLGFLVSFLYTAPAVLIALTLHELSHGYVALRSGDPTAQMLGRLTFNPLKHLSLFGTICMFLFGVGWAKPVPINPRNFRNYKRNYFLVSIAGIATNFILYILGVILTCIILHIMFPGSAMPEGIGNAFLRQDGIGYAYLQLGQEYFDFNLFEALNAKHIWLEHVLRFLSNFCLCNLSLALFNLLPFPPLDGYRLFDHVILRGRIRIPERVLQIGIVALLVINYTTDIISNFLYNVIIWVQTGVLFVILPLFGMA